MSDNLEWDISSAAPVSVKLTYNVRNHFALAKQKLTFLAFCIRILHWILNKNELDSNHFYS